MLVDSDTNVYEDQNIQFQETVEFNFRGKKQKVLSKKEKAKLDAKMRLKIRKEQIQKDEARKRKQIDAAPKSVMANTGVNGAGMRNQQNEYDYVATEHQIDDIGLESNSDSEDSGGDFEQYDKKRKEAKRQRQDELGVQLADAAEAAMMTPNQSILQQSPSAGPMEDDEELATEVNSDGETIAEDPDGVTTQDGKSLAELKRERERQNAMRNSNVVDDIAPAERRRLQQDMI